MILHGIQLARKLNFVIKLNKGTKFYHNLLIEGVVKHMVKWTGSDMLLRKSSKIPALECILIVVWVLGLMLHAVILVQI
jgi:hypothetical protein